MPILEMQQGSASIQAHEAQLEFLNLDSRFVGFIAGVGSGKTTAISIWALKKVLNKAGQKGLIATRTYPLLRDVLIPSFQDVTPEMLVTSWNKNESIMKFRNGSKVFFRPLETEKQIDRIRGYSLNWAVMDEAAYISEYALKVLNARLREGTDQQLAVSTTPRGYNWVYEKFHEPDEKIPRLREELEDCEDPVRKDEIKEELKELQRRRRKYKAVKFISSYANPFLPQEYLDSLQSQYSGDYYKQEIEGEFTKFEGLIYDEFSRHKHIVASSQVEDMNFQDFFFGYDSGYRHPRVALKIGRREDGTYVVAKEFYRRESRLQDAIGEFKRLGAETYELFADPSAKGEIEDMKGSGINATSANNEVEAGIQHVKNLLQTGDLLISELCQNTINEFNAYQWKGDEDNMKDKPLKEDDHAMDALRYALYTRKNQTIPMATL